MLIFDSNKGCALVVVPFHVDQVSLSFQFLNVTCYEMLLSWLISISIEENLCFPLI